MKREPTLQMCHLHNRKDVTLIHSQSGSDHRFYEKIYLWRGKETIFMIAFIFYLTFLLIFFFILSYR